MAIKENNSSIAELFDGKYEEGSEGKGGATETLIGKPVKVDFTTPFTGTLQNETGTLILKAKEGGKFKVVFNEMPQNINDLMNKQVMLLGVQLKDEIHNAVIVSTSAREVKLQNSKVRVKNQKEFEALAQVVKKFLQEYQPVAKNLLTARPGYEYKNGEMTDKLAIVAVVDQKINEGSLDRSEILPSTYNDIPVDVVSASPKDLLLYKFSKERPELAEVTNAIEPTFLESLVTDRPEETAEVIETTINYIPPENVKLDEVEEAMALVCHVSPEGGWKTLGPFLTDTTDHLQVAMYDFSAPQIFQTLKAVVKNGASLRLVYDGNPAANVGKGTKIDDVSEDTILNGLKKISGKNVEFTKAWKGNGGICFNAYHIKVAVKDSKQFWLSSGNWQTSNQPKEDFDSDISLLPKYNREWNILVDNKKLSDIFYKFIDWDFQRSQEKPEAGLLEIELPELFLPEAEPEIEEVSKFMLFPPKKLVFTKSAPLRVQPVLTPDNYMEHAVALIKSATATLYFQNQYIKLSKNITKEYEALLTLLSNVTNDNAIDCKIILRNERTDDTRAMLEDLKAFGFNMKKIRVMANTHTKGIIVDGKTIMLGSHNWSNAGVQFNRDASLVIYNDGVAQYYQDVLLHDWERRTQKKFNEEAMLFEGSSPEEASLVLDDVKRLDWSEYFS